MRPILYSLWSYPNTIGRHVYSVAITNTPLLNHLGLHTLEMSTNEHLLQHTESKTPHSLLPCGTQRISQHYCRLQWCLQTCGIWVIVSGAPRTALQSSSRQWEPREDHLLFWTGSWAELSIVFCICVSRALGRGLTVFRWRLVDICLRTNKWEVLLPCCFLYVHRRMH